MPERILREDTVVSVVALLDVDLVEVGGPKSVDLSQFGLRTSVMLLPACSRSALPDASFSIMYGPVATWLAP